MEFPAWLQVIDTENRGNPDSFQKYSNLRPSGIDTCEVYSCVGSCGGKNENLMDLEPLHPIQIERFRAMSFREKMAVSRGLFRLARRARLEAVRRAHPELDESERHERVAKEFARSRT